MWGFFMHAAHMHNGFATSMTGTEGPHCLPCAKDITQEVMDAALNFNQLTCIAYRNNNNNYNIKCQQENENIPFHINYTE